MHNVVSHAVSDTVSHAVSNGVTPRLFTLQRDEDLTGLSGTGTVADGALWPNGRVSICWRGDLSSIATWERLDDAIAIHGHNGATRFVFSD